jgi:transposase-like protein
MANAKYDPELKKEVIDAIVNGGRSSAQAARDYELPVTVVYTWVRSHKLKHDFGLAALSVTAVCAVEIGAGGTR